jgi:hypothetical protein
MQRSGFMGELKSNSEFTTPSPEYLTCLQNHVKSPTVQQTSKAEVEEELPDTIPNDELLDA